MTTSPSTPRRTFSRVAIAGLALAGLALAGCSSGGDSDASSGEMTTGDGAFAESDPGSGAGSDADTGTGASAPDPGVGSVDPASREGAPDLVSDPAVISTAVVSLTSKDASDARAEVIRVVDVHRGQVTDEETSTDGEGAVERSRMVIRVPASDFYDTVEELEGVAELESSDKSSENVSGQVIDTEVRIRAQEKSLRRIEVLLAGSQTRSDIVNVEGELTRRQAELDSLKAQRAYLADQTAMSTITVHLAQQDAPLPEKKKEPETDEAGFLVGLSGGWGALAAVGTVVATVAGALLPWAVVATLLGVPVWVVSRRVVRGRPA